MILRRISTLFCLPALLCCAGAAIMQAQVKPAAFRSGISLTAGGTVSAFNPEYGPYNLVGIGAYADLTVFRGIGIEGEARWQRFHTYDSINQDNYLIGPRVKVLHIWRAQPYVKVLGGFSNMNFEQNIATGRFTTIAYGGGVDLRVTKRISVRALDFEYQQWPKFLGSSLYPYGGSVGVGYRIF
jgi:opacity protein-like surface antigen